MNSKLLLGIGIILLSLTLLSFTQDVSGQNITVKGSKEILESDLPSAKHAAEEFLDALMKKDVRGASALMADIDLGIPMPVDKTKAIIQQLGGLDKVMGTFQSYEYSSFRHFGSDQMLSSLYLNYKAEFSKGTTDAYITVVNSDGTFKVLTFQFMARSKELNMKLFEEIFQNSGL